MKKYFCLLFLALFLFSCGPDYILDEEKEITNQAWTYGDSLSFNVDISNPTEIYNLYLDVEHSTEYGYQNMYIRLHSIFPDGKRVTEKVSVELMAKGGRWKGDCNSEECEYRMSIHEGATFKQAGNYRFVIEQFMRKNPLEGVQNLGLKIEETGNIR